MTTGYSSAAHFRYGLVLAHMRDHVPPPARVLELGAAPGEQAVGLASAGYDVTAVDIGSASDDWEGAPTGTMERRFEQAGVDLVLWDLERTPYPLDDAAYDAVVFTEVFEHLREYPATSLTEVARVLKPGGWFYFTTPNAAYIGNRLRLAAGRNVATPLRDWVGGVPHARHAREYTFTEADELLRGAGLVPEVVTSRHFHVDSGRRSLGARLGKRAIDLVAQIRPTLGPALIIFGRRPL